MPDFRTIRSLIAVALFCCAGVARGEDSADVRMIAGLRQRQLFELAEKYAAERLVAPDQDPALRSVMAGELIRTFAAHALNSPTADRNRWWTAAERVPTEYAKQFGGDPRQIIVEAQGALATLAQAEQVRQESELGAAGSETVEQTQALLRRSIAQLEGLLAEAKRLTIAADLQRGTPGLSAEALTGLSRNLQFELARALENQGLTYPPESLDRINSLSQALQTLEPLSKLGATSPIAWPSRLAKIRALRLLQKYAEADAAIQALAAESPPADVLLKAKAEQVRLALDAGQLDVAQKLISQGRTLQGVTAAELDFAYFLTYVALWQSAANNGDAAAQKWQAQASAVIRDLEQLYGAYWARRAELVLTQNAQSAGAKDIDLLQRTADGYFRRGQMEDALTTYDRAAAAAAEEKDAEREFRLRQTAAAVLAKLQRYADASKRLRQLANLFPAQEGADQTHLTAAYYQSLAMRADPTLDGKTYVDQLREHLIRWPTGPSNDSARMWLAQYELAAGNAGEAISTLLPIPANSAQAAEITAIAALAIRQHFATASAKGELLPQDVAKTQKFLEAYALTSPSDEARRIAAEALAELLLFYAKDGYATAQTTIRLAIQASPDAPADWRNRMQSLLVVALAGGGDEQGAAAALADVSGGEPDKLFQVIAALEQIGRTAGGEAQAKLARLQLQAIAQLKPRAAQLSPAQQAKLQQFEAAALAASGDRNAALTEMRRVAQAQPKDVVVQVALAELLADGGTPAEQREALNIWRLIGARMSQPQSDRWYQAKYESARLQIALGEKEEAAKLLQYLQALYPDLGGPQWKPKFTRLIGSLK
ncbi:hypothetical protein [Blastopirellula marina]|uniref:Uncharacterized protein n=1 Tax=Blastopirellula marina TaxID=124 RepID=A0A2S8GGI7_9BACT|nr:hypothetical protein [Blastopirellula marina]PQO40148.1 hypothetical protein C5Y98_05955 [Blastopirellula marina]PQO43582.1 hypothetical protein C5Y93_23320 [Blastopirellula marina]PTL45515.1 hypothetical protein C5Y97_05955 [Blastopirellula marina]